MVRLFLEDVKLRKKSGKGGDRPPLHPAGAGVLPVGAAVARGAAGGADAVVTHPLRSNQMVEIY